MITINRWDDFQHYKSSMRSKSAPPWIRLYRSLLDNMEYRHLSDSAARLLIDLWLLAAEENKDGDISIAIKELAWRLRDASKSLADYVVLLNELNNQGFINVDSNMLADCYQVASREERRGEERRRENTMSHSGDHEHTDEGLLTHLDSTDTPPPPAKPTSGRYEYPEEFEEVWGVYPKRAGDNPKKKAARAWSARLKEGHTFAELYDGTVRYAVWCSATGKLHTETVKMAATFFGPDKGFLEEWKAPAPGQPGGPVPEWAKVPQDDNRLWPWAREHGYRGPGTMTHQQYRQALRQQVEERLQRERESV